MPPQQKKKVAIDDRNTTTRRCGKASKKRPTKVCTKEDHAVANCNRHPGRTQDGYSAKGLKNKAMRQASHQAKAYAGS